MVTDIKKTNSKKCSFLTKIRQLLNSNVICLFSHVEKNYFADQGRQKRECKR